ncbi:MAG: hypothetical protein AAFY19_00540 [Pseudomonadota bacterium]
MAAYKMNVRLESQTGSIAVAGTYDVSIEDGAALDLLLHADLELDRLSVPEGFSARWNPSAALRENQLSKTGRITERALEGFDAFDAFDAVPQRVSFAYHGQLAKENFVNGRSTMSPEWTELSLGALWYPVNLSNAAATGHINGNVPKG